MSQTGPSLNRVGLAECVAVASACAPTKPLVKKAPETGKVEHLPVVRLLRARHELATAARASQESQTAQQAQLSEQELRSLLRKQSNHVPDSQFPSMPVSFATLTADEAVVRGGCAAGLVRCASACCMLLLPRRTSRCPPPLRRVGVGLCL
ncbi:hypothetical protein FJT64_022728 [Amphibalanus amphitrite]|uniref:Uncharacterized protein n=1 Tax=Amphibalanus amphitrite TaxID=1232801 RepID=A0A6A4WEC3_AMPAM|nr:hypothetical protein FJT64_022728 [Amphibalanus amphitrite]